jgi:hypothetical protein
LCPLEELENVGGNPILAEELKGSQHASGASDERSEVLEDSGLCHGALDDKVF